ncbi:MAG: mechanosensitive ion channel family protein [Halobacteriaceae archaeon]
MIRGDASEHLHRLDGRLELLVVHRRDLFAAISAGATIAIGFASQNLLSNLVSGALLVLDPEFHIGDWIVWNDREGIIEDIGFRVTRVHTFDNELITVPNSELTANAVVNPATKDTRRLTPQFGIGYEDDIAEARAIMLDVAEATEAIIDRPSPEVLVVDLDPSAVVLEARFWVGYPSRASLLRIESTYVQTVKERFDDAGIELPYPYRELTGSVGTWEEQPPDER